MSSTTTTPTTTPTVNSDRSIAIGRCEFLTDEMTVADLCEILEGLSSRRHEHALIVDRGVRTFLLGLLRERLPRMRREVSP
jgi:hypothetical protein